MIHSEFRIVDTVLGRIVVPRDAPRNGFLFWTTRDFDGRLDAGTVGLILSAVGEIGGRADRLETCRQVHGITSVEVTALERGWSECSDCDALWTGRRRIALGIKVADCLPVSII
ncbi:MAG: polyphenol oxidase family protein, partial [Acidobacteria bacterium]|nr:polyphenol oxidase family protein [Acidobacteriota bacterium]